jgi:hypothetical protein
MIVAHADWGMEPRKRWVALASKLGDGWSIASVHPWTPADDPLASLGIDGSGPGPILVGADLPIGLPRVFAEAAGIDSFPDVLPRLGDGPWVDFYTVAETPDQISLRRPFYPRSAGAKGVVSFAVASMRRRTTPPPAVSSGP